MVARLNEAIEHKFSIHLFGAEFYSQSQIGHSSTQPTNTFWILSDHTRLMQILLNLYMNALNQTEQGFVELIIRIERIRPANTVIDTTGHGYRTHSVNIELPIVAKPVQFDDEEVRVHVSVRDTGCGLNPGEVDTLFDVFAQVRKGSSSKGTGLGLVLVKQFVRLLGGEVRVTSPWKDGGTGTCFDFSFTSRTAPKEQVQHVPNRHGAIRSTLAVLEAVNNANGEAAITHAPPARTRVSANLEPIIVAEKATVPANPVSNHDPEARTREQTQDLSRPLAQEANIVEDAAKRAESLMKNFSVLLVDDITLNRTLLRRKLTSPPFQVLNWRVEEVSSWRKLLQFF
jgi:hypothetical protein